MTVDEVARVLTQPEKLREILSSAASRVGSVGVGVDPADKTQAVLRVYLTGEEASPLPESVEFEGGRLKILASTDFLAPKIQAN
jgi:hypothetical protein